MTLEWILLAIIIFIGIPAVNRMENQNNKDSFQGCVSRFF